MESKPGTHEIRDCCVVVVYVVSHVLAIGPRADVCPACILVDHPSFHDCRFYPGGGIQNHFSCFPIPLSDNGYALETPF